MANYTRKPNYHFKSKHSVGIDKVPAGRMVIVEDFEGDGSMETKTFIKKDHGANSKITASTTIGDALQTTGLKSNVLVEANNTNIVMNSMMTKAEFDKIAEANRDKFAGSGVINYGLYSSINVSEDLWVRHTTSWPGTNSLVLGYPENCCYRKSGRGTKQYPKYNVNGNEIKLAELNWGDGTFATGGVFKFAEASGMIPAITDSTKAPAMKQGDMTILKDLKRNFVPHVASSDDIIHNWTNNGTTERANITKVDNKIVKVQNKSGKQWGYLATNISGKDNYVKLIKGVKYEISFTLTETNDGMKFGTWSTGNNNFRGVVGENKVIYTPNRNEDRLHFYVQAGDNDSYFKIDVTTISIKQAQESPIVALQDIDAGDIKNNCTHFEARSSVSRQDLVFLETWHEDISEKGIVYPFGNVQYRGGDVHGCKGIIDGSFEGADSYSLFGNWQEPGALVGRGYPWEAMSLAEKTAFVGNKDNNIYVDGSKIIQVRYRIRVIKGINNKWHNVLANSSSNSLTAQSSGNWNVNAKGKSCVVPVYNEDISSSWSAKFMTKGHGIDATYADLGLFAMETGTDNDAVQVKIQKEAGAIVQALPIALVQRRNSGVWHETFNPEGTARVYYDGKAVISYLAPEGIIKSTADCFDHNLIATIDITDPTNASRLVNLDDGTDDASKYKATGTMLSKMSGRPDGLYSDEVNERDVEDLRMSAHKKTYEEILDEATTNAINGKVRGKETTKELILNYTVDSKHSTSGSGWYIYCDKNNLNLEVTLDKHNLINIDRRNWTSDLLSRGTLGEKTTAIIYHEDVGYETFGSFYAGNYYFGCSHSEDRSKLSKFANKKGVRIMVFSSLYSKYTQNNTSIACDIIGDPRKLKTRITLDIKSDAVVKITNNQYVLCSDNSSNGGRKGYYYRKIGGDIESIHTNSGDGKPNEEGGHIDFSDDHVWIELSNKGELGGYRKEWMEKGIDGIPLLYDENGENLLPINFDLREITYANNTGKCSNTRLSKRLRHAKTIVILDGEGNTVKTYTKFLGNGHGNDGEYWAVGMDSGHINEQGYNPIKNTVIFDWDQLEKFVTNALDFAIIKVYYETKANFLEIANFARAKASNTVIVDKRHDSAMVPMLINKVPQGRYADTSFKRFSNVSLGVANTQGIISTSHLENNGYPINIGSDLATENFGWDSLVNPVKYLPFLTEADSKARVQFIFKELKFDSQTKYRLPRDGVYANGQYVGGHHRSYTVAVFDKDGNYSEVRSFDVYGNNGNGRQNFKDFVKNIPVGSIVAVSTWDEPANGRDDEHKKLMESIGATRAILDSFNHRSSYALIGIKGSDKGTMLEERYSPRYQAGIVISYTTGDNTIKVVSDNFENKDIFFKNTGSWGDDNKFQVRNKISTLTDDNGNKVLYGQKYMNINYFIK